MCFVHIENKPRRASRRTVSAGDPKTLGGRRQGPEHTTASGAFGSAAKRFAFDW